MRIYLLKTGRVVVFRPFAKYIFFSSIDLAVEILTRRLTDERPARLELTSLDETIVLELNQAS